MAKQRILFFDIDGTLLNHEKQLPSSAKEAIFRLKEEGHIIAIATGRGPFMFTELRRELQIDTFVSYNGQYVVLNGEVLYKHPLQKNSIEKLTEIALQRNHPVVFMDSEDMKANVPEHRYIKESIASLKLSSFPTYDPIYYQGRDLYQALLFCTEGEEHSYVEEFNEFDFIRWHPYSVDILPKGGSKAKGIGKIAKSLGIPGESIYAFGDGLNDIEMLSTIENSVAMGNAVDEVQAAAKYVTTSVEDDGIANGLKLLGLLS